MNCKVCEKPLKEKQLVMPVDESAGEKSKEWIHEMCKDRTVKQPEEQKV